DAYLLKPGNKLAQDKLNCTANGVEITRVTPNDPSAECNLGQIFTFEADVTVRTNANARWDTTFYLPLTDASPQVVHGAGMRDCSMILPIPGDSGETADVELDGDQCGDITKALGPDEYVLTGESITMLCADEDQDNRADFTYCAAWDNIERSNCTTDEDPYAGQIPNNKSKCNCDTFNIDVFIKPTPPTVIKTLTSQSSRSEPGGTFSYTVSFVNTNPQTSLFITSLSDEIDIGGEGTFDASLNLWGSLDTVLPMVDGVYLTATSCSQPANGGEILPTATYSCAFTVHIVDRDLPNDQSPELYDDLVILALIDKNDDAVVNGDSCAAIPGSIAGDHCSNEIRVQITNLAPAITVTKTANPTEVLEPGANVEFTITVDNDAAFWDSPLLLTVLNDTDFGDLLTDECSAVATSIALGGTYTCTFTKFIGGDAGDLHSNTVSATATDDEGDTAGGSDSAMVDIRDVPSMITLVKTATPTSVLETGDDPNNYSFVSYNFTFSVNAAGVDSVSFTTLTDDMFGSLTGECMVDSMNGSAITPTTLNGFILLPGDYASCDISKGLRGNSGDTHVNVATIRGVDEDGQDVDASNDATVTFTPQAPDTDLAFATSMLVVLELTNAGIENVTLTALTVQGVTVGDGKLKNFLEKVNLTVTMTRFVPNEDEIPESQKPMPIILGSFADDGSELDERAGDGIFTVALPIAVLPGKYHVRIQSNNDVFLRAIEQDVLVYPTPIQVRFAQSRDKEKPHKLFVDTENGIFEEGSLIAHIEQVDPKGKITINQGQSEKGTNKLQLILPNSHALGRNSWQGRLYVTEKETQREIVFPLKQQNYSVVDLTDFTNTQKEYQARVKAEREAAEVRRLEQQRQDARFQTYLYIAIGNLVIILLVVSGIFGWRKLKSRKVEKEASLSLP
ncbi:MAG: hypothetical protein JKY55_09925, partial [Aliivibrio sp.]|uniref:choice-of-anchor X domain-containing protein n=1 Tax=Aliivibrio sp. TaxID=1872443 RepID=UPI001A3C7725|nr:hypothetical protein [Aliivibrio sp.]